MTEYVVKKLEAVTIADGSTIANMDLMSPYVWQEGGAYRIMLRAVPNPLGPHDPTGVIACGSSGDGLTFQIENDMAIVPSADPQIADAGGCEDPTVQQTADGRYLVFYTGVDAARKQGCMMFAEGADLAHLKKRKAVIKAPPGEGNIKEATLAQCPNGKWHLFYEYAANDASRIGLAVANNLEGPWESVDDPFSVREGGWDNWHLSTGPIITLPGRDPVMFYNGATRDARWRIGWVSFDTEFTKVTGRGIEPMITPPPSPDRSAADIAFAASAVISEEQIVLYYSLADCILQRATISAFP